MIEERYQSAQLTIARIRSDELNDDGPYDADLLPYYEGSRDALRALLEPGVGDV